MLSWNTSDVRVEEFSCQDRRLCQNTFHVRLEHFVRRHCMLDQNSSHVGMEHFVRTLCWNSSHVRLEHFACRVRTLCQHTFHVRLEHFHMSGHAVPKGAMEEDIPVAGPSHVMQAEAGSGEAGVSRLVKELDDEQPLLVMPFIIPSPAMQTKVDEVEMGESSAMAIDRREEGVQNLKTRI